MSALVATRVRDKTHRLIASRYPTVGVFDDLTTDKGELEAAFLLESITNDRIAAITRRLPLLPDGEIVQGPGATMVMAAFLHADETGGRFTDGRLGAWYAALDVATAIEETVYHNTRRLRLSAGGFPNSIQMRELVASIDCSLVDIRGQQASRPDLYRADDYTASRAFGTGLRWPANGAGENGIVFDSARRAGGTNVCLYRPALVPLPVLQADHFEYRWDRNGAVTMLKLTNVAPNQPRQ
jgi:hypothetical protein